MNTDVEKLWNQNSKTADADRNIHTDYMTKEVFFELFEQFKAEQKQDELLKKFVEKIEALSLHFRFQSLLDEYYKKQTV